MRRPSAAAAPIRSAVLGGAGAAAALEAAPSLDDERCWRAVVARDRRFEGRFVMGVRTTGIYCRPGCPARMPARRNVRFYASAAAAERAGFRACLRCRPETAPGSPAGAGTSAIVTRALRLIEAGALDGQSVEALAERLGVTSRWLRRLFVEHLGAGPLAVARTRRAHLARRLLESSTLPSEDIAAATGFGSARRMRSALGRAFGRATRALRAEGAVPDLPLALVLRSRGPLRAEPTLRFLAARAIPGMEIVERGAWRRTAATPAGPVIVEVTAGDDALRLAVRPPVAGSVSALIARVSRVFDLEADAPGIATSLRRDPRLRAKLPAHGVRVSGGWTPFEMGVRAIIGQQISVAAARTVLGRLVAACGTPIPRPEPGLTHLFPVPAAVAGADLAPLGLTRVRAATLRGFAEAVASGRVRLDPEIPIDERLARLAELPGFGDWTVQVIALRGFGEPDAFPAGDLVVRQQLGRPGRPASERDARRIAERWRPWRGYAAVALWTHAASIDAARTRTKPGTRRKS